MIIYIWAIERVKLDSATVTLAHTVWQNKLKLFRRLLNPVGLTRFGLFNKLRSPSGGPDATPDDIIANVQYFIGPQLGMLCAIMANVSGQHCHFSLSDGDLGTFNSDQPSLF